MSIPQKLFICKGADKLRPKNISQIIYQLLQDVKKISISYKHHQSWGQRQYKAFVISIEENLGKYIENHAVFLNDA